MAKVTFAQLKTEVAMKAEESGALPASVNVGGTQYAVRIPAEMKGAAIQALRNPAQLDELLDHAAFAAPDGTQIHA